MFARLIKLFASLRLTVVLLALGIAVVFFGTLAQTSDGLYVAQQRYFRSWFSTWSPHNLPWVIVPLPGGYLLGTLLLANLAVAHFTRFKFGWKKSGIFLTHLGVILLLLGQLATDMFARESRMSFAEGETRQYTEDFQKYELAFLTDGAQPGMEKVVAFPESLLQAGAVLRNSQLPFEVRVDEWMPNSSDPVFRAPNMKPAPPQAPNGIGQSFTFRAALETRKMDSKNVPTAIIEVLGTGGTNFGKWVVSGWSSDETMSKAIGQGWAEEMGPEMAARLYHRLTVRQEFSAGDRRYRVELRPVRYYQPFAMQLVQTTHEVYPGTKTPKNFQSRVRIDNRSTGDNREVDIYMNNPLRYKGLTFFQFQMGREELDASGRGTSVLQVVRNPSWLTPYAACGLVGAGLLVQFMIHLVGFITKQKRS